MLILAPEDRSRALARVDPRFRVGAALLLVLLVVLLDRWASLAAAGATAVLLLAGADSGRAATLRRLGELNLLALCILVCAPLSIPGRPLFAAGRLAWSVEGVRFALRVAAKANIVMLMCGALLASMEPSDLAHALYRLGAPPKLVHALFFCVRYLEVLHVEYHRLRNAMRLRAFQPRCTRHALRSLGYLLGMLFVRSVDRADRILVAMKCRGFDGRLYSLAAYAAGRREAVFTGLVLLAAGGVGLLEWS